MWSALSIEHLSHEDAEAAFDFIAQLIPLRNNVVDLVREDSARSSKHAVFSEDIAMALAV